MARNLATVIVLECLMINGSETMDFTKKVNNVDSLKS